MTTQRELADIAVAAAADAFERLAAVVRQSAFSVDDLIDAEIVLIDKVQMIDDLGVRNQVHAALHLLVSARESFHPIEAEAIHGDLSAWPDAAVRNSKSEQGDQDNQGNQAEHDG